MNSQQGLGLFGVLVIVALAAAAFYYAFMGVRGENDAVRSCSTALSDCLAKCRRTTTEAAEAQRCQQVCMREADACEASAE